jgi:hypothetical protein
MDISEDIKYLTLPGIEPHMVVEVNFHEFLTVEQPFNFSEETSPVY